MIIIIKIKQPVDVSSSKANVHVNSPLPVTSKRWRLVFFFFFICSSPLWQNTRKIQAGFLLIGVLEPKSLKTQQNLKRVSSSKKFYAQQRYCKLLSHSQALIFSWSLTGCSSASDHQAETKRQNKKNNNTKRKTLRKPLKDMDLHIYFFLFVFVWSVIITTQHFLNLIFPMIYWHHFLDVLKQLSPFFPLMYYLVTKYQQCQKSRNILPYITFLFTQMNN